MANASPQPAPAITSAPFGKAPSGAAVDLYTQRNARGMEARIATYGGIITHLTAPDRNGKYADVVLGYDTLDGYIKNSPYFGALIGRYGNRIAKGKFTPNGKTYTLATNNGPNSLHGGNVGFDKVVWKVVDAGIRPCQPSDASASGQSSGTSCARLTLSYLRRHPRPPGPDCGCPLHAGRQNAHTHG